VALLALHSRVPLYSIAPAPVETQALPLLSRLTIVDPADGADSLSKKKGYTTRFSLNYRFSDYQLAILDKPFGFGAGISILPWA
jgi:hypothetical protein